MKLPNLENVMISISEIKKQLSEVVNKGMTKVIVKNNMPVSVIMPYDDYIEMTKNTNDLQKQLKSVGQEITLSNGVRVMVCVEHTQDEIIIKTFKKMKTTGDYKLHFTQRLGHPRYEETLTTEELRKYYFGEDNQ